MREYLCFIGEKKKKRAFLVTAKALLAMLDNINIP